MEGAVADTGLPAKVADLLASVRALENGNDLLFGKDDTQYAWLYSWGAGQLLVGQFVISYTFVAVPRRSADPSCAAA
jgi:hypothetical protein